MSFIFGVRKYYFLGDVTSSMKDKIYINVQKTIRYFTARIIADYYFPDDRFVES